MIYNKAATLPRRKYAYVDTKKKLQQKPYVPKGGGYDLVSFASSDAAYYMSKSIITFTMLYCTLNWLYYKKCKDAADEADGKKQNNKQNNKK
jgi:hypothetical protein